MGKIGNIINIYTSEVFGEYMLDKPVNALITSRSRNGKTTLAKKIAANAGAKSVLVLDTENEWLGNELIEQNKTFHYYSPGSLRINIWKVPSGVSRQEWADALIGLFCDTFRLSDEDREDFTNAVYDAYKEGAPSFSRIHRQLKSEKNKDILYFLKDRSDRETILFGSYDGVCVEDFIGKERISILSTKRLFKIAPFVLRVILYCAGLFARRKDFPDTLVVLENLDLIGIGDEARISEKLHILATTLLPTRIPESFLRDCDLLFVGRTIDVGSAALLGKRIDTPFALDVIPSFCFVYSSEPVALRPDCYCSR